MHFFKNCFVLPFSAQLILNVSRSLEHAVLFFVLVFKFVVSLGTLIKFFVSNEMFYGQNNSECFQNIWSSSNSSSEVISLSARKLGADF